MAFSARPARSSSSSALSALPIDSPVLRSDFIGEASATPPSYRPRLLSVPNIFLRSSLDGNITFIAPAIVGIPDTVSAPTRCNARPKRASSVFSSSSRSSSPCPAKSNAVCMSTPSISEPGLFPVIASYKLYIRVVVTSVFICWRGVI